MPLITFTYTEGEADGLLHTQTTGVTRLIDNDATIEDVTNFLAHALRAAGYTYVDRVGIATERGEEKWSKF